MPFALRIAARKASPMSVRTLTTTAVRRDLVQDLYLSQLKSYKTPAKAQDAHLSSVKTFSAPSKPTAPSLPSDLTSELSKFDSSEPVLASTPSSSSSATKDVSAGGDHAGFESASGFLEAAKADIKKDEAHH